MRLSFTTHRALVGSSAFIIITCVLAPSPSIAQPPQCTPAAALASVAQLPEGSGLAASRRIPGRFWAHNDSGDPVLFALDSNGRVAGRLLLSGTAVEDWEAVAVGPCPSGSCIYVGDIGDNDAERSRITIYRVPEPADANGAARVTDVFHATYPDGAHDAETLLIAPDGRLHVVTKGDTGPVVLYRFPNALRTGTPVRLERVGESRPGSATDRVTDGAVSPSGDWVVLRSTEALMSYRAADLFTGNWREVGRVPLGTLGEPQGEGVTFGTDNALFLMSEGGGKQQPGRFGRLTCMLDQATP
jgi:hypothetical protein